MTDYKQLCAELVDWAEKTSAHYYSQPGVLLRARAALAEPEPEGPTDEELEEEFGRALLNLPGDSMNATAVAFARAVLARWATTRDLQIVQPSPLSSDQLMTQQLSPAAQGVMETALLHQIRGYAAAAVLRTVANLFEVLFDEHDNLIEAVSVNDLLAIADEIEA